MSEIDFSKYKTVDHIEDDIRTVTIQGATNVAIATFEGIKLFIDQYKGNDSFEIFWKEVVEVGIRLSEARVNEPLAKNGVKFIQTMFKIKYEGVHDVETAKVKVGELADEYLVFIKQAKSKIVENSIEVLDGVNEVLTHCHSSTAERIITYQSNQIENFKAVCTETRPLFQGRITAKNLLDAGVDTTMIADSAVESFIIGRGSMPVDMVFIGADEITMQGNTINKIGSWGVALAAYYASVPIYVVGSILKTDVSTLYRPPVIELREAHELWKEAPKDLKLVNPSFDLVDNQLITGYITEAGILKPNEIASTIQNEYQWLF